MRHSIGLAWVAGFLIASAAPLHAQSTIQKARDILNNRTPAPVAPAPAPVAPAPVEPPRVETGRRTTVIVPDREVLVIERVQTRYPWWKHPRYRMITVYYDGHRFYRRPFDRRPLRKVVVYQHAGRYYIDEVQWKRDHRRHYGRDYDRWDDDKRRRDDDRGRDDNRWRDDDRRDDDRRDDARRDDNRRKDDDKRNDDHDKDRSKGNNGRHLGHDKDRD
jgi:hypothetical protein